MTSRSAGLLALAAALLTVISFHNLFAGTVLGFLVSAALVVSVRLPTSVPGPRRGVLRPGPWIAAAIALAVDRMGGIDVCVNCAGIVIGEKTLGREGPHRLDGFRRTIEVNLIGSQHTVRAALPEVLAAIGEWGPTPLPQPRRSSRPPRKSWPPRSRPPRKPPRRSSRP